MGAPPPVSDRSAMRDLFGLPLTRRALNERFGAIDQLAGIRPAVLADGLAEGLRILEVRTGTGFRFDVLAGRGLDIGSAEYRGTPIAWRAPTGDVAAAHFETQGLGWLRSFHGGLLVGCGLRWMGSQSTDGEEPLGLHGRLSNTPAEQVSVETRWEGDEYILRIRGMVREARVLREHLQLDRTITTRLGQDGFEVHDIVTNAGFTATPHMLLYHMNFGYPVVSEESRLVARVRRVRARDADAALGLDRFDRFDPPSASRPEQVFFLDLEADGAGNCTVAVVRSVPSPLGVAISFPKAAFPYFGLWKMGQPGTYALGLEPANALVEGLAVEREQGRLQILEPGESREYRLRLSLLTTQSEIDCLQEDESLRTTAPLLDLADDPDNDPNKER
jgi:galactose mutarotase-like enzyme